MTLSNNRKYPLEYVRNIGIVAHIDAGKTTSTERILYYSGVVHKLGEVHEGTAVTDWMDQERERGITITSAAISCNWSCQYGPFANIKHCINVIDTPGHVDFTAEVERSLRVLDGAIGIFCSVAGVQPQSETVWRQMDKYNVPRLTFINKLDRIGANYYAAIESIRLKLGVNVHPIYLPIGIEEKFIGVIDLVTMKAAIYNISDPSGVSFKWKSIPEELLLNAKSYRDKLIEAVADFDEEITQNYLDNKPITNYKLKQAIRKATLSRKFVGVIPGSALKNKGIQMLMDAIVDYLPSPLDVEPMNAFDKTNKVIEKIKPDDTAKACGLVFKLFSDPYVGKLVFFRLYRGSIVKGQNLYNPRSKKIERISRIMLIKADTRKDIECAYSGDIFAIVGIKNVITGDTLCDRDTPVTLEPPSFPEPVISMYIEPHSKCDQDKLSLSLRRLAEEDPTFRVYNQEETGETIISGMGELHLEIIRDRLLREFKVSTQAGRPQISYRETISKPSSGVGKFVRQTGGRGQYGHGVIKLEPNDRGKGNKIINEIVGGVIPKEYIKPFSEGILEAAKNGILAGYPVIDWKVRIIDGSYHEVDSSDIAFKMAGIFAFRNAMEKAVAYLLEPIMSVEIVTPEEYQGDVVGDLNSRRGLIQKIESKPNIVVLNAFVPLETMFGYATDIRSLTRGRASYLMSPSHFDRVPDNILKTIINKSPKGSARTQ